MKLHDAVKIKEDIPEEDLEKGMIGVIVVIFHDPCLGSSVTKTDGLLRRLPCCRADRISNPSEIVCYWLRGR